MPRARTTSSKRTRCKSAAGRPPVGGKFCRCQYANGFWKKQVAKGRAKHVTRTERGRRRRVVVLNDTCHADLSGLRGLGDDLPLASAPRRRWLWLLGFTVLGVAGAVVAKRLLGHGTAAASPAPPDGTAAPAPAASSSVGRRIVALGDSYMAGILPYLKGALPRDTVTGEGFVGQRISVIHDRGAKYLSGGADVVVIEGGINNVAGGGSADKAIAEWDAYAQAAKAAGRYLVALTVTPCPKYPNCVKGESGRQKLNDHIRGSSLPDKVLDLEEFPQSMMGGLHPTATGYKAMAVMIVGVLP